MYDRAPRTISKPCGSTAPGVGPGTYNPQDKNRLRESYAPFQSMAVRESFLTVGDSLAAAPGPGHYSTSGSGLGTDRGRGALHNKAERFLSPSSKTPGPGAYSISKHSDWIRKTYPPPQSVPGIPQTASFHNKDMLRVGHVTFHRQQTAPSIPMPGQNYGYEEDDDGSLKPQALPPSDSSMGPAYYNVSYEDTETTQKYKGVHFGNLKSHRSLFRGAEGPGPGDYDPRQKLKTKQGNIKTAVPSNLPRYHQLVTKLEEKKAVPGPGQYEIKSQFEKRTLEEEEEEDEQGETGTTRKAPFGSSLQRFLSPKNSSPASTTYQDPRTAFESSKRLTGMSKAPFGQTSSRFRANRHAKFLPGPGAYNNSNVTSMATELTKKTILSQIQGIHRHPFGTTSVRTAPLIKKDELHMPGPAHYQHDPTSDDPTGDPDGNPDPPQTRVQKPKKSFMFSSTSRRLHSPPSIVTDIPPPGSYEVSDAYHKSQGRLDVNARVINSTFLSTSERFAPPRDILLEEPDTLNPGPGEYDSQGALGQGKGGLLCCKDNRFKGHSSIVPGPGAYQMSETQRNTLLRGTFNVSLTNPLSPREQNKLQPASSRKQAAFVLGV